MKCREQEGGQLFEGPVISDIRFKGGDYSRGDNYSRLGDYLGKYAFKARVRPQVELKMLFLYMFGMFFYASKPN